MRHAKHKRPTDRCCREAAAGHDGRHFNPHPGIMWLGVLPALLLAASCAQAASVAHRPTAGQLLQQTAPQAKQPRAGARVPLVVPKAPNRPANSTPLPVQQIIITGNTVFPDAVLQSVIAPELAQPQPVTLTRLANMAQRITAYYHAHGYLLAHAYVPAQVLGGHGARLAVLEAHYGKIRINNDSRVADRTLHGYLTGLQPGDPVRRRALYRSLLMLDELPGAMVKARLAPGTAAGASNLYVDAAAAPLFSGRLSVDNNANDATDRTRFSGLLNVNSPLHRGDRLSLYGLSTGEGLNYGQLSYVLPVGGDGSRIGASYSYLHYHLQNDFDDLGAKGSARVASVWAQYPLLLTGRSIVTIRLQWDHKNFEDEVEVSDVDDKRSLNALGLSLIASHKDRLLGGGITGFSLTGRVGDLRFHDAAAEDADAATARTRGNYRLLRMALSRVQSLTGATRLYLGINGQYSPDNLDSSEQFLLGGMYNMDGFDLGTLSGSSGYLATLAVRHDLPIPFGHWQAAVFADAGRIQINADPWTHDTNYASLMDVGLGLDWSGPGQWQATTRIAKPVGDVPDIVGSYPATRIWFLVSKGF